MLTAIRGRPAERTLEEHRRARPQGSDPTGTVTAVRNVIRSRATQLARPRP